MKFILLRFLMAYTPRAANAFKIIKGRKLHEMPVLLTGDFNLDTRPGKNNDWFIEFMKEELGLEIRNDPAQSTTLGGSAIDHIFTRRLSHLKSVNYATYFSYHKPRLTITET